jgi:outer membrane protein OmpA-like peptidoglycan-associated protein
MIKPGQYRNFGMLIAFALAASGCVSKKYVSKQIAPVNQKLAQFEKETNDRIAFLNNKQQADMAQLNDRLSTTDQKVTQMQASVQEAQGTASRAMEESSKTETATTTVDVESELMKALNYQMVDKADVTFGFNKATLTRADKTTLDEVVSKCKSNPRAIVELAGFTDHIGSASYNLALSRSRAWAVQRYLVEHDVPLRSIHMVGFGKDKPPEGLEAETQTAASARRGERNREMRRVNIRVFGPGETTSSDGSQQQP